MDNTKDLIGYYCMDADGEMHIYPHMVERDLDGDWWCKQNCEGCTGCLVIKPEQVARLGLPDITSADEPIPVRIVCVNV